jgi:hypothetical protein
LKQFCLLIETNNRRLKEIEDNLKSLNETKLNKDSYELKSVNMEKDIKLAWNGVIGAEAKLKETDIYLEKYLPIHT